MGFVDIVMDKVVWLVWVHNKTYKDFLGYSLKSSLWFELSMSTRLTNFQLAKKFQCAHRLAYVTSSSGFEPPMSVNI